MHRVAGERLYLAAHSRCICGVRASERARPLDLRASEKLRDVPCDG
jgi:hypothetical protein